MAQVHSSGIAVPVSHDKPSPDSDDSVANSHNSNHNPHHHHAHLHVAASWSEGRTWASSNQPHISTKNIHAHPHHHTHNQFHKPSSAKDPSSSIAPPPTFLSRKFVARRISEGETGRLKEELKCQACGKGYKHISSLAKHLWEHTPEWNVTSKLLISKHQQVQLLEAASILVSMNEGDEDEEVIASEDASEEQTEQTEQTEQANHDLEPPKLEVHDDTETSPKHPPSLKSTKRSAHNDSSVFSDGSSPSPPPQPDTPNPVNGSTDPLSIQPNKLRPNLRGSSVARSSVSSRYLYTSKSPITDSLFSEATEPLSNGLFASSPGFSTSISTLRHDEIEVLSSPRQSPGIDSARRLSSVRQQVEAMDVDDDENDIPADTDDGVFGAMD